jgi:hypothetical protein
VFGGTVVICMNLQSTPSKIVDTWKNFARKVNGSRFLFSSNNGFVYFNSINTCAITRKLGQPRCYNGKFVSSSVRSIVGLKNCLLYSCTHVEMFLIDTIMGDVFLLYTTHQA